MNPSSFAEHAADFSSGGGEPYARLLQTDRDGTLSLRRMSGDGAGEPWSVAALRAPADHDDLAAIGELDGPLLDVGCGPGRMVRAAAGLAMPALGIDVSVHAVRLTTADGTPALERSIFERLPLEGRWRTVLLMDGNIGIGGDPDALLDRCLALLAGGGSLVIEADADADLDDRALFTVVDDLDNESAPFPWARIGWRTAERTALAAGFDATEHRVAGSRHFVRATRRLDDTTAPTTAAPIAITTAASQHTSSTVA